MNNTAFQKSIFLVLLLLPCLLTAQIITLDPVFNPDHIKIHRIGPEEGMSGPYLMSAFQDQCGYIWIGSENGVDMYDGYNFRNIRIRESDSVFSQLNYVVQFADDKDGGVWLCSSKKGLYYYDRSKDELIAQFPQADHPDFPFKGVYGISRDSRGLYWIFTGRGLFHYDSEKDTIIHTGIPLSFNWHWTQVEDFNLLERADGSVWIPAAPNGLFKYIPETDQFINYRHDPDNSNSISSDNVTNILEDGEGNLWITTLGGGLNILNSTDQKTFELISYDPGNKNSIFSDSLNTLKMDSSGNIWIAGIDGFSKYQPDKREFKSFRIKRKYFDYSLPDLRNSIREIIEDHDGFIWLRPKVGHGLFCFNPESEQLYQFADIQDDKQGLVGGNWVIELFTDQAGLIWAVTQGALNIIEKHPQKPFHLFRHEMNVSGTLSTSKVGSIYLDSKGILWIGTEGVVLNRCSEFRNNLPDKFSHYPFNEMLKQSGTGFIFAIIEDDAENLWLGTGGGLYTFDRSSEKFSPFKPVMDSLFYSLVVYGIYKAKNGFLWVGTNYGLFIYDPQSDKLAHYDTDRDDPEGLLPWLFTFCEDKAGNMWIGHYGFGISMLAKDEISKVFTSENIKFNRYSKTFGSSSDLSSDQVMQIHQDRRNRIWIGTTAGLNLFYPQDESFYSFHEADGLPNDCIYGILEDDHDNLWVSTMKGISKIVLEDGYGQDIIKSTHNYGSYEGIMQPVFNEKSCFKTPDGWMYFGGVYGLTVFHPDSIKENPIIPPVFITNILINDRAITDMEKPVLDKSILETESIKLPFRQNFLSFEYVALNYLIAEKNQYRYIMEGIDENWVEAGTRRFAEYRDLKPGEYTFRVIASNEDGLWNEEGASIGIIIHPPWYKANLAYGSYGVLFFLALFGFIRWRTWNLERDKRMLEAQVKERTKQITRQKDEIESQRDEVIRQKDKVEETLEQLRQTQNQLIQSEKLASLGGLVAGVAHEINTPVGIGVTAISSLLEDTRHMADLYKKEQISRKDFKEFLQTTNNSARLIQKNLERTAQLVQSFKQVSVDQSSEEQREFLLKAYLEDVIRSLYPKFKGRDISINVECNEKLKLNSFPGVYAQIFTNLILNSITHGFPGDSEGAIDIMVKQENNKLNIEYKDNGIGIPKDILPKIFDPFFTTEQSKGTGLGLNIVYNLITQKLNGTIECESKKGGGALFEIRVPVGE